MCGIFLCKTNNGDASIKVLNGLKSLEYRGYDSWGIASLTPDKSVELKRQVGKVGLVRSDYFTNKSNLAIGHTRWATHGKVSVDNSHPHISNNQQFVVVHNGIFENYQDHKQNLEKENFKFYSETDTEVLVNLVQKKGTKGMRNIFKSVKGENAFIILDKQTGEIFLAKKGSPLHIGQNGCEVLVSSDRNIILENCTKVYSLSDGEVVSLNEIGNLKFEDVKKQTQTVSDKQTFSHFTLKEIFDQTTSCGLAYKHNQPLAKVLGKHWYKGKNIFVSGCGTAYNAAQLFALLCAQKGVNAKAIPANEMETVDKLVDKQTILFLFSQSGETADSIIFAKQVLKKGGKVYSVLNAEGSTLSSLSHKSFYTKSGKEVAVASTKAFTGMVLASIKLLGFTVPGSDFKVLDQFINQDLVENINKIVGEYLRINDLFLIGKDLESVITMETALKIKETSYIHAEGFAAGELKHGVLALIESGVLSIIFSSQEKYQSQIDNAGIQIKSRGGKCLGIGLENKNYYDHFIQIPNTKSLNPILSTVVGQIVAYCFAVVRGLDPDKPRNLAKSVTVK